MNKIFVFWLILVSSLLVVLGFTSNERIDVSLEVKVVEVDEKNAKAALMLILLSNVSGLDLIYDCKVFSNCYVSSKKQLIPRNDTLTSLIDDFKKNAVIMENRKGEKRIFSTYINPCDEVHLVNEFDNCLSTCIKKVCLEKGEKQVFKTRNSVGVNSIETSSRRTCCLFKLICKSSIVRMCAVERGGERLVLLKIALIRASSSK